MNAIIGMTELAIGLARNGRQREYLQAVKSAGASLLRLIDDVLDFSKIEARKLTIDRIPFRLDELLDETVKPLAFHARQRKLKLSYAIPRGTPRRLIGDPNRLRQVLVNLIGNAIKFTSEGSITVKVRTELESEDEVTLVFTVRDTGIGIAKHQQSLIFDAFSQADSSTTRTYGGTGLGLSISKELIELMGGTLAVNSAQGVGSTFRFTARFERGLKPAPTGTKKHFSAGVTLRILLAEDNAVNQRLTSELLERRGHRVTSVRDGKAALGAIATHAFDVVLMDIQMPVLGGIEATQAIREKQKKTGRHIPIVAMTAHALASDRDRALKAGMDDYITKPARVEEVYRRVERAALLGGFAGDRKLAAEVIDVFLSDAPKMIGRLQRAVRSRKLDAIQHAAHALKGSIGNFTTGLTFEAARKLEHAARERNLPEVKSRFIELRAEVGKLIRSLQEVREDLI